MRVDFDIDRSVPLYQSTTAQIRYLNLIGDRYVELKRGDGEGADRVLPSGGFIPLHGLNGGGFGNHGIDGGQGEFVREVASVMRVEGD